MHQNAMFIASNEEIRTQNKNKLNHKKNDSTILSWSPLDSKPT